MGLMFVLDSIAGVWNSSLVNEVPLSEKIISGKPKCDIDTSQYFNSSLRGCR